ncbi:MAG: metal ABC transporter permease [Veillonellaceae bacterium]|nr:metal ABC transporter permease [Veillonellaceae bacterium]
MIDAIVKYIFLQNAIMAAVLASVACGIIGTFIMEKKLVMMSGGIAHTAFGGIGLGYYLKVEPILTALGVSVIAAVAVAAVKRRAMTDSDLLIGMFWSLGMALGVVFIALTPGYPPDTASYLFGNILAVSRADLKLILGLDVLVVLTVCSLFQVFKAYIFDEEFSNVAGVPVRLLEYLLFVLVAVTVVILIRVVGIILVIALLTAPPAIAKQFSYDMKKIMAISVFLGIVFSLSGLWLSYTVRLASGASIVMVAVGTYALVSLLQVAARPKGGAQG